MDRDRRLHAAHDALQRGALDAARAILEAEVSRAGGWPAGRHMLAIIERRAGRLGAAQGHFEELLALGVRDPAIHNGFANLLDDLGQFDRARLEYEKALALAPGHVDTLLNYGLLLRKTDKLEEALATLEAAARIAPDRAPVWHTLGLVLDALDRPADAAAALDRALALNPNHPGVLNARAGAEARLGGKALPFLDRAAALAPGDPTITLGRAVSMIEEGDAAAAEGLLAPLVAANPRWLDGQATLARLRWQQGDLAEWDKAYRAGLAAAPQDARLWSGYLAMLLRAGGHDAVLAQIAAARTAGDAIELDRFEAAAASQSEDLAAADAVFAKLQRSSDVAVRTALVRHRLRLGDVAGAAGLAEAVVRDPGGSAAWPYLATAWRLLSRPEWQWLEGNERLIGVFDLATVAPRLDELAAALRGLHKARAAPLGQTLRGGTQTEGNLLLRREPIFAALRAAFEEAVAAHVSQLGPADARHPTLGVPRDRPRIAGSWSVRLTRDGFHTNHVHPNGWLSSAFYVSLPGSIGGDGSQAGWLAFGEPPAELGLDLPAFRTVKPQQSRLVLFPSTMWHGTRPFADGERLTVAFDVVPGD